MALKTKSSKFSAKGLICTNPTKKKIKSGDEFYLTSTITSTKKKNEFNYQKKTDIQIDNKNNFKSNDVEMKLNLNELKVKLINNDSIETSFQNALEAFDGKFIPEKIGFREEEKENILDFLNK